MGYILGLGGPYLHDASACLVDGSGAVVAFVEEERLNRRKHSRHLRSCTLSTAYCLAQAGIRLEDVDEIAVAWNPRWPDAAEYVTDVELIRELLEPNFFNGFTPRRLTIVDHHVAHAASAFYPSGFPEAAVLVVDGSGDGVSTSLYHGTRNGLRRLCEYSASQSLGYFYETVAEYLDLGQSTSGAGKLMGLAAYGQPVLTFDFLQTGNECLLDLSRYNFPPDFEAEYPNPAYYTQLKNAYAQAFAELGVPRRRRPKPHSTVGLVDEFSQDQLNLAASAQQALERCLLQLVRDLLAATGSTRLCVSGGVALNCAANGVLQKFSGAQDLFVQPISGDAGCAIGAALECSRREGKFSIPTQTMISAAFGPSYTDEAIRAELDTFRIDYNYYGEDIFRFAAHQISRGSALAWFQGPCEGGPRALGHRSILADPRIRSSRDRLNHSIKQRDRWRPLAPSILASFAEEFIVNPGSANFMVVAYEATPMARAKIPAVVHVDGSTRPQLVLSDVNPPYAKLIQAFAEETGVPALLNTSFNRSDEPIVCSPSDALRTFFTTPLDVLVMGGFAIGKKSNN